MNAQDDERLIARFVETFCKLDGDCWGTLKNPPPDELNAGIDPKDWANVLWRPAPVRVGADELKAFY